MLVLVLLPTIAPVLGGDAPDSTAADRGRGSAGVADLALGKAAIFAVLMIVAGARLVPWLLTFVARQGSRELFTLAVLAIALGIAFVSSAVFGVSFALGAFLAGAVVGESDMSHQAAADALPLRDAFAVLFFVSVGMLLDPAYLSPTRSPILACSSLIVVGKALVEVRDRRRCSATRSATGLTVGAGLAQIGEFSFILGHGRSDASACCRTTGSSSSSPARCSRSRSTRSCFGAIDPLERRLRENAGLQRLGERRAGDLARLGPDDDREPLRGHAILCGFGRVGRLIGPALDRRGFRYVVVTLQRRRGRAAAGARDPGDLRRRRPTRTRWPVRTSTPPAS